MRLMLFLLLPFGELNAAEKGGIEKRFYEEFPAAIERLVESQKVLHGKGTIFQEYHEQGKSVTTEIEFFIDHESTRLNRKTTSSNSVKPVRKFFMRTADLSLIGEFSTEDRVSIVYRGREITGQMTTAFEVSMWQFIKTVYTTADFGTQTIYDKIKNGTWSIIGIRTVNEKDQLVEVTFQFKEMSKSQPEMSASGKAVAIFSPNEGWAAREWYIQSGPPYNFSSRFLIKRLRRLANGGWIPEEISIEHFSDGKKSPSETVRYNLEDCDTGPIDPGVFSPAAVGLPADSSRRSSSRFAVLFIIGFTGLVIYLLWRRRSSSRAAKSA